MNQPAQHLTITQQTLAGIGIFSGLSPDQRNAIAPLCQGRRFQPNQMIVASSDTSNDVYFIVSGQVRVALYSRTGKEVILRDMVAGNLFGEISAIDGRQRSAYVQAVTETRVVQVTRERFMEILQAYPPVALRVMQHMAGLIRSLSERVFEYDALNVNSRIHAELLRLARSNPAGPNTARIEPAPTDENFARRIGTNREAVNKELRKLARNGLIEKGRGRIDVLDVALLRQLAGDSGEE